MLSCVALNRYGFGEVGGHFMLFGGAAWNFTYAALSRVSISRNETQVRLTDVGRYGVGRVTRRIVWRCLLAEPKSFNYHGLEGATKLLHYSWKLTPMSLHEWMKEANVSCIFLGSVTHGNSYSLAKVKYHYTVFRMPLVQQIPDNHPMLNHTTLLFAPNFAMIKWNVNKFALIIAHKNPDNCTY